MSVRDGERRVCMTAEHVLVTGGAGFIGSHVADALLSAGYEVAVLDDLHTGKRENVAAAARFYLADIRDAEAMERVFTQRDFVYVADVARANVLALQCGSGVYNLGTGVPTDVDTIFRELARLTAYRRPEQYGPAKLGEVRTTYLDCSRARRELDWKPLESLSEGLDRTVAFFRDQRSL